jgi:hypothetical protein
MSFYTDWTFFLILGVCMGVCVFVITRISNVAASYVSGSEGRRDLGEGLAELQRVWQGQRCQKNYETLA